ncbi:MAG: hypothetical protein NPIRA05_06100 [Nitrospirales bacterium]|nr:MAG: hypothetical protein NPIRA05_06100 [Nitrospirales bacterium]
MSRLLLGSIDQNESLAWLVKRFSQKLKDFSHEICNTNDEIRFIATNSFPHLTLPLIEAAAQSGEKSIRISQLLAFQSVGLQGTVIIELADAVLYGNISFELAAKS